MGTLANAGEELWALVHLLRSLEGRDFSSRVAAQITASILVVRILALFLECRSNVLALPLRGHDAVARWVRRTDEVIWATLQPRWQPLSCHSCSLFRRTPPWSLTTGPRPSAT